MKKTTTLLCVENGAEFFLAVSPNFDEDSTKPNNWDGIYATAEEGLDVLKDMSVRYETDGYLYRCTPVITVQTFREQIISGPTLPKRFLAWWNRHW